jgi:K+-sensing histidine kinase KdpD
VRFARDNQITQIVVGPGRRGRWSQLLRGSAISKIISVAAVAGLDVHLLGFPPGEQ